MELGCHTVDHAYWDMTEPVMRYEIEAIWRAWPLPPMPRPRWFRCWPFGSNTSGSGGGADYFLGRALQHQSTGGGNAADWMNLKSYNSHEHARILQRI